MPTPSPTHHVATILDTYALLYAANRRPWETSLRLAYTAACEGDHATAATFLPTPDPSAPHLRHRIATLCLSARREASQPHP